MPDRELAIDVAGTLNASPLERDVGCCVAPPVGQSTSLSVRARYLDVNLDVKHISQCKQSASLPSG